MQGKSTKRTAANQGHPCPVCGATSKCSVGEDGLILCRKARGEVAGFKHCGTSKLDAQWQMYRRDDDPLLYTSGRTPPPPPHPKGGKGKPAEIPRHPEILMRAQACRANLTHAHAENLARLLELPLHALDAIPLLGYAPKDKRGPCWVFPEHDGEGRVVGLCRRWGDGSKGVVAGTHSALTLPEGWADGEGPVLVVEGASDTLALRTLGLSVVGRPSNTGGVAFLERLFRDVGPTRTVVVMGEVDPKSDGTWPGLAGCQGVAEQLARALPNPVRWALPPGQHKDCRAWFAHHRLRTADADSLERAGEEFLGLLKPELARPTPQEQAGGAAGLSTHKASTVDPKVLYWLTPGYFPRGKTILLAGESGQGKSLVMLYIASCLSTGRPLFGLNYTPPPAGKVLYIQCEDCEDDTVLPRLLAAGADLDKILLVDGVRDEKGHRLPFSFAHLKQIEAELAKDPDILAVMCEPVNAYLSGTEIDAFKSESVRACLMNPLKELGDKFRTTFFLLKHFNKGGASSAKARVADSAAFVETARANYAMMPDPDDERVKLFLELKCNLTNPPQGLKYRITQPGDSQRAEILQALGGRLDAAELVEFERQLVCVEFVGTTEYNANDLVKEADMPARDTTFEQGKAAAWLRRFLAAGPRPAADCHETGNEECDLAQPLKWWRDKVLKSLKGESKKAGFQGLSYWLLPGQHLENLKESKESSESPKNPSESKESKESGGGDLADDAFPPPPSPQ